jgi:hypothetical protein
MSSIYDKSSLVLIPSGTKTGKVFSQKPTNGDGDFTFTRASAATRVNADGNIEKETQNLLTKSNTLSAWSNSNTTETGGQSGYDGSSDAWLVTKSNSNAFIGISASYSGVFTQSVYAKAGSLNWVALQNSGISQTLTWFDLQNGVTGSAQSSVISHSITDVGNGWYRCEVTYNGSSSTFRIFPSVSDNNTSGTSGNIYIQDAQLEQGLVARDYIETTTSAVYGGITDNVPRLDYTDSSCPALLLEPLRTNLLTQSEYFAAWIQFNTTNTANALISPEGIQNANKLIATSGVNNNVIYQGLTAGTYTASMFAKKGEFEGLVIATGTTGAFFNLNTNTYRTHYQNPPTSYFIEDFGNGWHRYGITFTESGANNIYIGPNDNVSNTLGVTGNNSDGVYIYGATLEAGTYPTSYIPTYGSSVTRGKDDCTLNDAASVIANAKGSFYIEGKIDFLDTNGIIPLTAGIGTADLFYLWIRTNGVVSAEWYNGALQAAINSNINLINVGDSFKMAVAYQDNDFVLYINGTLIGTDTSGNAPYPTLLRIGKYNVDNYTGGSYTNAMVFPTRLSNQELQDLTTL